MRSENLEELPEKSVDLERTSFFSKLMKSENLPLDEATAMVPRVPHGSGIFASEPLPSDDLPEPHGGRASFIATLFSREPLPADPAPGPRPVGRGFGR
jgi:hypothetical protein